MGKTQNFIEFVDVHKKIREQPILRGVNFGVGEGETLVVLGYSGAGKSVMLRHILGLMKPDAGKILVDGVDVASLPEKKLAPTRKKVGMLFQNGALFDSMDVAGNVAFPLRERGEDNPKVLDQKVLHSLELVGLEDHLEKMPVELSGGMKKRIALAADSIDHLIRRLKQRLGVTSVVVTHDMKSARHIADHVAMLRDGEIYFYGTPDELMASEDPVLQDFVEGRSGETS